VKHVFQVSLGPVQGFIAASRKTRDLKAGSDLLSDMAEAAVRAISSPATKLIFPADESHKAANIILAIVEQDPKALADKVEEGVRRFLVDQWQKLVDTAKCFEEKQVAIGRDQVENFPEVFAAWAPLNGGYQAARKACGKAMAARKALRDFAQPKSSPGLPKSPLAPWLDTVLPIGEGLRVRQGLGPRLGHLKERETLDAMSLIKRLRDPDGAEGFPSTRTIAASNFIAQLDCDFVKEIKQGLRESGADCDIGDLVFDDIDRQAVAGLQSRLQKEAKSKKLKKPRPYFAVLHADGDSMGRFLDAVGDDPERHRNFSRILYEEFSIKVAPIVKEHSGRCVFAGGDDVLALLPLDAAIECATEIHKLFESAMNLAKVECGAQEAPTLSVGLALVHCLENLQETVAYSARLEHLAKNVDGKNALAIGARARSGSDVNLVIPWATDQPQKLQEIIDAIGDEDRVPRGFPYEVRQLLREMEMLGSGEKSLSAAQQVDWVKGEIARVADKKEPKVDPALFDWIQSTDDAKAFRDMLLVAHFLTREAE